jgi:serine O-acetyltransferase
MHTNPIQSLQRQEIKERILASANQTLGALIKADSSRLRNTESAWTYPGFWVVVGYRIAHHFHTRGTDWLAKFFQAIVAILTGCNISRKAVIGPGLRLDHPKDIFVGSYVYLGSNCNLGSHVFIGSNLDHSDPDDYPVIDDWLTIAVGGVILGGLTLGKRIRVSPNAVVMKDIPDEHDVVPIPGRAVPRAAWKKS